MFVTRALPRKRIVTSRDNALVGRLRGRQHQDLQVVKHSQRQADSQIFITKTPGGLFGRTGLRGTKAG